MRTQFLIRRLVNMVFLILGLLGLFVFNSLTMIGEEELVEEETVTFGTSSEMATASLQLGKKIFKANCAACHNRNMKDDLTGPALAGVEDRWAAYPREDLFRWIRNSQLMVHEKHPRALELWNAWSRTVMTPFPKFKDEEIEAILEYIRYQY